MRLFPVVAVLFLASVAPVLAQAAFQVGQRVHIGTMNEDGTVIAISNTMANGGTLIKVHLDRLGDAFKDQGVWVDTMVTNTQAGGGGAAAPAQAAAQQAAPAQAAQP